MTRDSLRNITIAQPCLCLNNDEFSGTIGT